VQSDWTEKAALLAAAALGPLVVFWPTLSYGFLLDDFVLYQRSASLANLGSIAHGFVSDVGAVRKGAETVISSYYRPVFLALSTLYYQVVGGREAAWHAAAVGLAALIGALACGFLWRLGMPPVLALLASLAFSLHPAHTSSVAWASGLQELLAATFVLVALHAALWRRPAGAAVPIGLAALAYALALLSKEVAIGLPLFVGVWAASLWRSDRAEARRLGRIAGALAVVTVVYLLVRVAVLGGLALPSPGAPRLAAALASTPIAAGAYLRLLLWPTGFSILRPERPVFQPTDAAVWLTAAALIALGILAGWAIRRQRRLLLPVAWLVVWLLPVLNLWALEPQWMVTDRYLFLPALALPWALAVLLPRRAGTIALAVLAVAFAGLTLRYSAIFRDQRTFLAAMERAEPSSPLVFAEKGRLLQQDGDRAGARAAYLRAVELDPLAPGALLALADLELQSDDFDAAERHARQALIVRPYASRPFKLLAIALSRAGLRERALAIAEESARRWPSDFEAQLLDALLLGAAGERQRGALAFDAARRLRPQDPAVVGGFDAALARLLPTVQPRPR